MECLHDVVTPRQAEVLDVHCEGLTYKQVADKLGITANTVDSHLQNIREKTKLPFNVIRAKWLREKISRELAGG